MTEIEFMEDQPPAGFYQRRHVAQGGGRIGLIEQHVASDSGVEQGATLEFVQFDLLEIDVIRAAVLSCPPPRPGERLSIPVDTQNTAVGTHKIRRQQGNVPHAAAEIENAHTGRQSACAEKTFGACSKDGRLLQQALLFVLGVSQHIVGSGHQRASS